MCILTGGSGGGGRQHKVGKKNTDGAVGLVNPSPVCFPVFVQRNLQPKKTNAEREHPQADAGR